MRTRTFVIAIALLAGAAAAHAQDGRLERVQNLIATGRLSEARNTLTQWERDNADPRSSATSDERARALYLAGALSTDAKAAEDAFLGVVLSYPSSPVAPEALLRLGQGLYAAGENDRAIMYLDRLRSDYPRSPQRETGLLWLSRAQLARGDAAAACGTARESLFGTTNENVRTLIELERDRACAQSGGIANDPAPASDAAPRRRDSDPAAALDGNPAARTASPTPRAEVRPDNAPAPRSAQRADPLPDLGIAVDDNMREPPRSQDPPRPDRSPDARTSDARPASDPAAAAPARASDNSPRTDAAPANGPEFAVQTAAFSERRPAETIAAELRAKGFDARIVQVPGSPYFRVRFGAFATNRDAAAAALHVRDAGFATLIVNDVRLERRP
jgi:cell division protein FtsN